MKNQITLSEAKNIFTEDVKPIWGDVKILSIDEKKNAYLFEFSELDDDFPVDYPIISVNKADGSVMELIFTNKEHRKIIYGE